MENEMIKEGITVPIKVTVSIMVICGSIWWAATVSAKLDNVNQNMVSGLNGLEAKIERVDKEHRETRQDLRDLNAYVISTREKLAAKGILK